MAHIPAFLLGSLQAVERGQGSAASLDQVHAAGDVLPDVSSR